MSPIILIAIFIGSSILGYFLIKNVPSLLHTPLMSGVNALSGITILGGLIIIPMLIENNLNILAAVLGGLSLVLATINVVGGFLVTNRMLMLFHKKEDRET